MTTSELHGRNEADTSAVSEPASGGNVRVTLEGLGKEILARVAKGDTAKERADQLYKSAGLQLIEARRRSPRFLSLPS
jgi:hypothetical protein